MPILKTEQTVNDWGLIEVTYVTKDDNWEYVLLKDNKRISKKDIEDANGVIKDDTLALSNEFIKETELTKPQKKQVGDLIKSWSDKKELSLHVDILKSLLDRPIATKTIKETTKYDLKDAQYIKVKKLMAKVVDVPVTDTNDVLPVSNSGAEQGTFTSSRQF